jgi:hypothetical protein
LAYWALVGAWTNIAKDASLTIKNCEDGCLCALDPKDPTNWKVTTALLLTKFKDAQGDEFEAMAPYEKSTRTLQGDCVDGIDFV